jgi:hypothetical protein
VRIAFWGVEEEVADPGAGDVLVLGRDIGEDDARCDGGGGPLLSGLAQVGLSEFRKAKEPEPGGREILEDAQPGAESRGLDLRKES